MIDRPILETEERFVAERLLMTQEEKEYERFKLLWMISHGYTLRDLIGELEKMREESDDATTIQSLFDDWEFGYGFGSEIWPCFNEFMEHEYMEEHDLCAGQDNQVYEYPYPAADHVSVGSIVITRNCLDVGIVGSVSDGRPVTVYARPDLSVDNIDRKYGGVVSVGWYDTGLVMTMEGWRLLSLEKRDAQGFYQYWRDKLKKKRVPALADTQ